MTELLTQLRGVPRRVFHRLYRQRALRALRSRPRVTSLLVICRGNSCRSPFAAALLDRALSRQQPPPEAVAAAARHGVDLSVHRSQRVTAESVRAADLIVVMDLTQRHEICVRFGRTERDVLVLGDLDPQPIETRRIRDPVRQPLAVFEQTYARIERCVRELTRAVTATV
ncbi:MAG: hypothetical protein DMD67_06310 [Gemmatimonadetes bacterium]|nr:MAG: hypothetical protein DMD67_06310 [Gemmatimonadota bacterium]